MSYVVVAADERSPYPSLPLHCAQCADLACENPLARYPIILTQGYNNDDNGGIICHESIRHATIMKCISRNGRSPLKYSTPGWLIFLAKTRLNIEAAWFHNSRIYRCVRVPNRLVRSCRLVERKRRWSVEMCYHGMLFFIHILYHSLHCK